MAEWSGAGLHAEDHAEFAASEVVERPRVGSFDDLDVRAELGQHLVQTGPNLFQRSLVALLILFFTRLKGKPVYRISICLYCHGAFARRGSAGWTNRHTEFRDGETLTGQTSQSRFFQARIYEVSTCALQGFQEFLCFEWCSIETDQFSERVPHGEIADDCPSSDHCLAAE